MLSPRDSPIGKQLSQYVCVRITRMDDIDIGLFDYDRYNTLYFFLLNADEQIYMRYGGRDAKSPDTYLNLSSLELALKKGLELHRQYERGEWESQPRPEPLFPRDIPLLVERTFARNRCVECHLIGDFQNVHREQDGTLNKLAEMYRSPDIKTLGVILDVPRGLVVKEAQGAAGAAAIKPGDRITGLNGTPVWTFGDLQYNYDQVDRRAERIEVSVDRAGHSLDLPVVLPVRWWWTDIRFRNWSIEPRLYFETQPLREAQIQKHRLKPDGFAGEVKYVNQFAEMLKSHDLEVGDIVYGIDGVERDEHAHTVELFLTLRRTAGDSVTMQVIRDGKRMEMPLKTFRTTFRK